MARPRVELHKRRKLNVLRALATVEEKEFIRNKAASLGISMSELFIRSALGYKVVSFDKETKMLLHELLKIGNNVNQITRQLNAIVRDGRKGELQKFDMYEKEFAELRLQIDKIVNALK